MGARLTVTKSTSTGNIVPIGANCGMTVVEDTTPDDNTDNTYTITDLSTERMYNYLSFSGLKAAISLAQADDAFQGSSLQQKNKTNTHVSEWFATK